MGGLCLRGLPSSLAAPMTELVLPVRQPLEHLFAPSAKHGSRFQEPSHGRSELLGDVRRMHWREVLALGQHSDEPARHGIEILPAEKDFSEPLFGVDGLDELLGARRGLGRCRRRSAAWSGRRRSSRSGRTGAGA
jgi:hypothetical protein